MDKRNDVTPTPQFHPRLVEIVPPGAGKSDLVVRMMRIMREGESQSAAAETGADNRK